MTFKVGDRIRRVGNARPWAPIGYETTVTGYPDDLTYTDQLGDEGVCISSDDWERVGLAEIVEGTFGIVKVWQDVQEGQMVVEIEPTRLEREQLRAAAAVLLELAGALEE